MSQSSFSEQREATYAAAKYDSRIADAVANLDDMRIVRSPTRDTDSSDDNDDDDDGETVDDETVVNESVEDFRRLQSPIPPHSACCPCACRGFEPNGRREPQRGQIRLPWLACLGLLPLIWVVVMTCVIFKSMGASGVCSLIAASGRVFGRISRIAGCIYEILKRD